MRKNSAFSLVELSIVIIIIGILIAAIVQGSRMVNASRLSTARSLTQTAPVNETPNLLLWYETSLASSFIPSEASDGNPISTWYDNASQLVNRNNATQGTSANQPLYIENVFNGGIPAIRFNGTSALLNFDGSALIGSNYTIFVVEQKRSAAVSNWFVGGTGVLTNSDLILGWRTDTDVTQAHYFNDLDYTNSAIAYNNSPTARMHTFWFNQSTGFGKAYWLNGGTSSDAASTSQTGALVSYANPSIGRGTGNFYNGDIAEIIIFTRALKTSEREAIEAYLGKKYNIVIS